MMGRRRIIFVVVLALGLLSFVTSSNAADWYVCQVKEAGLHGKLIVKLRLSDTGSPQAFKDVSFTTPAALAKEMLAIALTAISLNCNVKAFIDLDKRIIGRLYIVAP